MMTRYAEFCPRGFQNEVVVYAFEPADLSAVEAEVSRMNNTPNGRARILPAEWQPKRWQAISWGERDQ